MLLAGGRGNRLDGALKPALEYQGQSLLSSTISAAQRVLGTPMRTVVVGDAERLRPAVSGLSGSAELLWTREEPAFSGPVAALSAALTLVPQRWLLLLAADLPDPEAGIRALLGASGGADGALLVDAAGKEQQLFALYRRQPLLEAVRQSESDNGRKPGKGASLRSVIARLELARVPAPGRSAEDIDDWADAARWGIAKGTP